VQAKKIGSIPENSKGLFFNFETQTCPWDHPDPYSVDKRSRKPRNEADRSPHSNVEARNK